MNSKSKKIIKRIAAVIASLMILPFLIYGFFYLAVPVSRPSDAVRSYVLRKIPIGTDWNDVIKIADKQNWEVLSAFTDRGLSVSKITGGILYEEEGDKNDPILDVVGEQVMWVNLGEYPPFLTICYVSVYLAFDENGKLIEAFIRKDYESI